MFSFLLVSCLSQLQWKRYSNEQETITLNLDEMSDFALIIENCADFVLRVRVVGDIYTNGILVIKNSSVTVDSFATLYFNKIFTDSQIIGSGNARTDYLYIPESKAEQSIYIQCFKKYYNTQVLNFNPPAGNYDCLFLLYPDLLVRDTSNGIYLKNGDSTIEFPTKYVFVTAGEKIIMRGSAKQVYTIRTDVEVELNDDSQPSNALIELKINNHAECYYYSGPFIIKDSFCSVTTYSNRLRVSLNSSCEVTIKAGGTDVNTIDYIKYIGSPTVNFDFDVKLNMSNIKCLTESKSSLTISGQKIDLYIDREILENENLYIYWCSNLHFHFDIKYAGPNLKKFNYNKAVSLSIDLSSLGTNEKGQFLTSEIDRINNNHLLIFKFDSFNEVNFSPSDQFNPDFPIYRTHKDSQNNIYIEIIQKPELFELHACFLNNPSLCPSGYINLDQNTLITKMSEFTYSFYIKIDNSPSFKVSPISSIIKTIDIDNLDSSNVHNILFSSIKSDLVKLNNVNLRSEGIFYTEKIDVKGNCLIGALGDTMFSSISQRGVSTFTIDFLIDDINLNIRGEISTIIFTKNVYLDSIDLKFNSIRSDLTFHSKTFVISSAKSMKFNNLIVDNSLSLSNVELMSVKTINALSINLDKSSLQIDTNIENNPNIVLSNSKIASSAANLKLGTINLESSIFNMPSTNVVNSIITSTKSEISMASLNCEKASFDNQENIVSVVCSISFVTNGGTQKISSISSPTIHINSNIQGINTISNVYSLNVYKQGSFKPIPYVTLQNGRENISVICEKQTSLKFDEVRTDKLILENVVVTSVKNSIIYIKTLETDSVQFSSDTQFTQLQEGLPIVLKEKSSSMTKIKCLFKNPFGIPYLNLNNFEVNFQNSVINLDKIELYNSNVVDASFIVETVVDVFEKTFYSDTKTSLAFSKINSVAPIKFTNIKIVNLASMNIHKVYFDNSEFDGEIIMGQGTIETTNTSMQEFKATITSASGVTLINAFVTVLNNISFNGIYLYNSLFNLIGDDTNEHSVNADLYTFRYADRLPAKTHIILMCPEDFKIKDVEEIEKTVNIFFLGEWRLFQKKETQTLDFNFINVKNLILEFDKNITYFSKLHIVNRPESVELTMIGFQKVEEVIDFPITKRVTSITLESGCFPFNAVGLEAINVKGGAKGNFENVVLDKDVNVEGIAVFKNITVNSNILIKNSEGNTIEADNLFLKANRLIAISPIYIKNLFINISGKISVSDSIVYDGAFIDTNISNLNDVLLNGNVNVQYSLDANNTLDSVGNLTECGVDMLNFVPYPPNIDINGKNAQINIACYDNMLCFYIPNNLDNHNIIYVTFKQVVILVSVLGSIGGLMLLSIILIVYCRYISGDFEEISVETSDLSSSTS